MNSSTRRWQRTFEGSLEQLGSIREFILDVAQRCGANEEDAFACELACDEAAANVFYHAFENSRGRIEIVARHDGGALVMEMRYRGRSFDPSRVPEPDRAAVLEHRPTGGLGLYFMRQLMDQVAFEFDTARGNLLTMRRILNLAERHGAMQLQVERPASDAAVIQIQGSVDGSNFQRLIARAQELYAVGARKIVLDVSGCEYMSSSGLVALNAIAKLLRGDNPADVESGWTVLKTRDDARTPRSSSHLALVNPTPRVERVLDLAGLKHLIPVYADSSSALAALA